MNAEQYGVQVTRNGYGIHVGTWDKGALGDLTVEEAAELVEKLTGVLDPFQPGVRVRSRVTSARGELIRREGPFWVVRVDEPGLAQGEGLRWHPSNILPVEEDA